LSEQVEPVLKETKGKSTLASMVDIKVNYGLFEIILILGNNIDRACSDMLLAEHSCDELNMFTWSKYH